jgi:hypothetical protein
MSNDDSKINLIINSKKIRNVNKNANDILITIGDGIIKCNPDTQYIEMNIINWVIKNDFYSTSENNNKFEIIYKDNEGFVLNTLYLIIDIGNYNVDEMANKLNALLQGICLIEYIPTLDKYKYSQVETGNIYIKSITAAYFLGLDNNVEYQLTEYQLTSTLVLNMQGDSAILLEIANLSTNSTILDNIDNGDVQASLIACNITIDVPSYALLKYENMDGGNSFSYILLDKEIKYLNLLVKNQSKEFIEIPDYDVTIQFIIRNRNNYSQLSVLKSIDKSLKIIIQLLGDLWRKYTR